MANPNDNLYRLYQNGLKHFSLPDFDTFKQDMMDEQKRRRFYTNMQDAYSLPDFDTFSKDIGTVAPPPAAAPAQPVAQAQPQQQAVTPTVQPIKDNTAQQASVKSATTPAQPAGWKPSPVQQRYMQFQMDQANARLKKMGEDFHQRMEGIEKGNRPGSFMGEREFNPQTGQMEKVFYTTQGERVPTQMQKIKADSDYHQWWENNTEAGKRSKEQRLQREFDARLSGLWQRHDPSKVDEAAEAAWSSARERYETEARRNAAEVHKSSGNAMGDAALLGGRENHIMNAARLSQKNQVSRLTNFDLDRLMSESWDNLGEEKQKALVDDCYKMLQYRNPGVDGLVLYNQAKQLALIQTGRRVYDLAVEKHRPKNELEYLARKIGDANLLKSLTTGMAVSEAGTTGDMAAYEAANEAYRQDGHKVLDVVGTVVGMAADPTMMISGGVGGLATRGAIWAGGRYMAGRGASALASKAAARSFGTTLTGRIAGGLAGGAATFGTFEGVKEMENQFAHGGHIVGQDETGRYINEGYSAGAVAGQFGHGLMMGAAVGWLGPVSGNVSDKLVRATSSTVGKVATRAGVYTGATLAEGTIFSVPEWIEGERDAMDVWSDNMAMMVGFKAKHMIKSAGGVLGDLKASFDSPTNGQKNRLDFESRLRQRMDAPSDGGMALTEEEKAELKRYGYDLRDLVESSERTGDPAERSLIAQNAPEIVSRLTDMVNDPRISEAARAKMYYFATGRMLPMSTVMRGELIEDGDGGFIVESHGANGVITSRSFKSRKAADLELERIKRQTELNTIEIGERYQQTADFENRLQEACRTVAAENGWDMVEVYRTCEEARRNHLRGGDKQFDEAQQNVLRKVTDAMGDFKEAGVTDEIRGRINEKYGVDIDGAIRKEANRRTVQEQTAIDEYLNELIPDKAKEANPVEDAQAEDITHQKLLSDEPAEPQGPADGEPIDPRFDNSTPSEEFDPHQPNGDLSATGRAVMKFQDRPVEVLSGRVVMMEDGSMVDNERSDASIVIRDVATGKIEMVSPEAILSYEEYAAPTEEAPTMPGDATEVPEVEPQSKYTSGQIKIRNSDGTETRGVLTGYVDENGNHEYYVEGDLQHLHYASEHELDNILSEYQPDEPQQPSAEQPQAAERVYPEGVTDTEAYDNGLEDGAASTSMSDEELNNNIARFSDESEVSSLTDYGRGWVEGLKQEQQRRIQAAQPQQPEQVAPIEPTPAPAPTPEPTAAPTPKPAQAPAEEPQGDVSMPTGVNPVGTISVPQRDGSTRTFTVGKDAEGQNVVVDDRGFMWAHDGNGNSMQPYSPGANVPTWTDEQLSKLGAVQPNTATSNDGFIPIDPSIKPDENGVITVPNQPENVPTSGETPQNSTENGVSSAESIPNPAAPVENVQETPAPTAEQTPLQRIPRDAKGEPIFEQAENPEHGWDALVEFAEGDAATAKEIADTMAEEKRKAYEKAQKQKPKGKTPTEILASKKAISAGLAQAEQEYNLWQQMANVEQRRQDAIRAQQEAEARQKAAERAEAEKAEREAREEAARLEREALEGIPEWHLDTPENARKRGSRRYQGQLYTRQEPVEGVTGDEVEVKFSKKDLPKGRLAVIEASQLQSSHIQGQRNPMFFIDEAQPKNRNDEGVSAMEAKEIAEKIQPKEVTVGTTAFTGAPTVNSRGEVIQGNNRSDALRYLWENKLPEQQSQYKQYLLDNAERFGLDRDAVEAMQQPVLVNMLDVDDAEAIRLGQKTQKDIESGGIERIKPKNVAETLGDEMRTFANMLLHSGDEEATFGQLVDRNGMNVLQWLSLKNAITETEYKSARDSKGNLTAEAKNDLQKILYQAVFKGGSQQLEEMFDKLPAKAQRAILSTAFRDMDSPFASKMLPEIQASISAYNLLMNDPAFAEAKNMEQVLRAVEAFKQQIALDDRFEQYMPADNFSNFALHLAGLYKASDMSQTTIAGYFNQMYDLAQGKKAATLFEEADTTEYPLADVIKQVLNIDYKPAKNGNNNVENGGADVALRNQDGQGGELRGNESPASGEQNQTGTEPSNRGAGASGDGGTGREIVQDNLPEEKAVAHIDPRTMPDDEKSRRGNMLRNAPAIEVTVGQIVATKEISARKAAEQWWDENVGEPAFYDTEVGEVEINKNSVESSLAHKYGQMKLDAITSLVEGFENAVYLGSMPDFIRQEGVNNHFFAYPISYNGKRCYVFCRAMEDANKNRLYVHEVFVSDKIKKGDTLQTAASQPHGGIALYREILANVLESHGKNARELYNRHTTDKQSAETDGASQESEQSGTTDSSRMSAPATPERKVNNSASEKQGKGEESSDETSAAASAQSGTSATAPARKGSAGGDSARRRVPEGMGHEEFDESVRGWKKNLTEASDEELREIVDKWERIFDDEDIDRYAATYVKTVAAEELLEERRSASSGRGGAEAGDAPDSGMADGDTIGAKIAAAEAEVNTSPTPAQAEAGNYKKGHVTIGEFDITIENPAGSVRKGVDADGKEWSNTMANTYGYIKGTEGVDGDHIDVFLHSDMDQWNGRKVFVVDQTNTDGSFDEHKVMLGFNDKDEAMTAYLANYDKTWADTHPGLRISETNIEDFNKWVQASHRKTKPFADYTTVSKVVDEAPVKSEQQQPEQPTANIGERYKIESKPYTNKQGKTLDTYLVTFDRDFSKEELSALRAKAKALKGWYDRESKGWMLRSSEDAKAFADDVTAKSEDEVADEAPLSMADMEKPKPAAKPKKAEPLMSDRGTTGGPLSDTGIVEGALGKKYRHENGNNYLVIGKKITKDGVKVTRIDRGGSYDAYISVPELADALSNGNWHPAEESPMKQVDVEGVFDALKTKGETKLSGHATPVQYKDPLTEDVIATLAKWDMAPTHKLAESRLARHYSISFARAGRILREIQELSKPTADNTSKTTDTPVEEAPKPKKRRWISDEDADEFDSLRKDLRSHFGKDGDIVQEAGAEYGKPKPKQMDAEVLRMGTRMTYLMMKGGLRSFSDYCEAMKDELPDIFDDMRPHLKSLYAAAQNMEEVIELGWDEEMDDRKTVKAFDVYNFDKPGAKDIIATAQHAVDENASQQQTDQIIQTLKDQRNEQRKKEADETSADTEAVIDKAEATASQVESKLEAANSEEDAERLSRGLDKELEEVNKQLALLGYYEADPVDKDFNEAYGYMRNAERKAAQDAHRLATQLAADLGITIDPKDKVRKAKYGFGSKIARSNVAPAGGEVYITLPLAEGRELSIWLSLDKNEPWRDGGREDRTDEDLMLTGIMYRIENTGKGGMSRYESSNHNTRPTIPYDELLSDIRRLVRTYLPDETVKPATPLAPQPGEDMVDMAKRVAADKEPKAPAVEPQQTMASLFGDELGYFDNQGNPIDKNGEYIVEEIKSVSEISDDDFMNSTRNVVLPELSGRVSDVIGAEGRKPMIKKNIFGKNRDSHKDLTAEDGRRILNEVLYNPNLYGQNQKVSRPYNWIMVHLAEKNSAVVLEVNPTKEYLEIVNWHYLKGRQLEQKKRQAEREGGRILTLQESNAAGDTSQGLSSDSKVNKKTLENKENEKTDVQTRTEGTGRGGQQPRPDEPLGEGAKNEAERTDGGRMAQRSGEHSVSDTGRGAGVSGLHQSERSVTAPRIPAAPKNTRNNHAERGTDYAPKGEKARIDANIAALELAKKLLASGATATPQEMAILRRYSGWGGLGAAFNEGSAWAPNPINKRLRDALTPEEYQAAVMSRNSAYYTPAAVIDAMWDVAKALGFKGGNIVEGSAGIGNIIGLMPTDISKRSNIHAVEIDPTTGGILSLLYPDAKVEVQGFEQTRIANGSVDLAITNVPFVTDLHVMDESGDSDLSKKFRDIHDFCIAKNVRKLREGGIGIFITSSGTLDKSQKLRNWLVGDKEGNADVVGVFRMNNQTFGGTAATSDIIVVRKRVNGRKSANAIDVSTVTPARTATFTDARGKTKDLPLYVNRYFIEHPEHMGGEMFFGFEQGDTYRPTSIGLFPTRTADQAARMAAWVQHLADMDWGSSATASAQSRREDWINEALGEGVKEGSMVTDSEGNLCVARMGRAVPLTLNKNKIKGRTKEECFKDYSEIKDALAEVLKYQTEHDDDAGLQPKLDRLNRAYDTFVQRYGNLNKNNNLAWLRNDVDFSSIVALETYSEKGNKDGTKVKTYGKTDIFSRRVVEKESEPSPKNVKDGIIASIYKYGRIDTEYLATQLGKPQEEVKQEIVDSGLGFVDPTTGQMEVSYEYLSGNVREKLRQAREANEAAGGAYDTNIKALEAVVPMNIPAHLIEFALGSSWIEPQLYERYVKERTELDVKLTNAGGTWHMAEPWNTDKPKNTEMGVRSEALGILIPGHKLIEAALTNKTITVSRTVKDSDGGSHTETDQAATTACATKVDEIRQDFKDWAREQMQNDPILSMHMEQVYNEKFNNSVPKSIPDEFVPEHFGGAATTVGGSPFKLRPHQAKAVIRATTQPVLLAHEVGTGKTYTLITTAMEMRRLGTARKPMIVVQNATVGQFVASAKALYPNAKVLTLEDADRNAEGRRAFYAKIKFNDWDMIVVPQSVFERIPDSIERQTQFIQDKIEEKMLVLEQMKEADPNGRSMIVRAAEREISRLEDEMTQLASGEPQPTSGKKKKDAKKEAITRQNAEVKARELLDRATDDVEDFDSMGIDAILVDEAHEYKHLGFATAMQRGVKGVDPSPSKKSQGVFLKTQTVLEKTGGKNVVFATGTPISNTAAEIWTFMRYLIPSDVMKDYDIYYFDDFVRNFGNLQQMLEFKTNGKYDEVNRFAGYVNLPELVRIWSTVADTVLTREAGGVSDKIPQMEGGKAQDIFLPQTRALRSIMKFVKEELKRYEDMTGKEKKENSHIPLVMYGIAKAAAVDARLVQSDAEDDPNSKTNEAVRQTLRTLEETKDYKGTVAIFADNYQNKHSGFNLYEDIRKKLIAAGVPEEQVVVMKSGMTVKKKLEIFDRVNAGEVRVVMGSTFTLGTGVNIQERLHTLIHLDAPNRPMDYTQRNGRILRQGNLHNTWGLPVRVLRFGVEDSLDVTAYQRLKTKGAIADSIMNGKQLMANSMENRSLEEDQDLFGDITAQLSGSEYAMLKNQIEKEVRKLRAAEKNWKADQTYIHNRKRHIAGQNREAEKRIADNQSYLEKVEAATIGDITVGKLSFPTVESMEDFFTEQNKKKAAMQEEVRTSGYSSRPATSDITISVGGFDFKIHTEITKEMKHQQGDLFATAPAKMTYSCPELGIDAMPVRGNAIKNAVLDIMENVVSGKDFRERIAHAENYLERNNAELEAISKRDGQPFKDAEALEKAEEKLAEYEELMKAEMAAKEAKYAEMDKDVEAAAGIELTEEDSEPTASEPVADYSAENANFVSRYETKDGKTVRYTSENPEAYGGLFDFDFSNDVPGAENTAEGGRVNRRQQSNPPLQRRNAALLDTNASARLNEADGEYCALERKFRESNYMEFTSAEKVESADDVAFIFEELENASVENVFVVMTKRGVPTVMHISIGGFNWSAMNAAPVKLAYDRIKPDKVYFVHNHPSGALNCSPQDVDCLKKIEGAIGKKAEGVIMDLKSGKYGTFDSSGTGSSASHDKAPAPAVQRRLRLYAFDRHVFNPDYQPSEKMSNAEDVAKFLSSHRLGDRSKVSVLVCDNQNQIVANVHTTHVSIDSKGLADDIIRAISEFGGMRAFLYGDFEQSGMVAYRNLTQAVKERSGGVYNLLDVVRIEGNHTWSARDNGYVYEPGSEYGASPEGDIRFREVEDDAVLKEFAEGKTVKAYRTMQVIDGKLYSPMATKVGGKATPEIKLGVPEQAEEHPEIIKRTKVGRDRVEVGYVVIDKGLGKGTLEIAYNPSIHASRTALNDQFTSGHIRPNLVTVEVEIPLSELTSGYRAKFAKDAVGEISWNSGAVSGQLAKLGKPRRVILSRYDRPVRVVPFREVAAMIADQLDGTDIAIPYNVVQPQVRAELELLGVAISEEATGSVGKGADFGEAEYVTDQEIERINARQQKMAQTSDEAKSNHAVRMSKRLNTPIRIVNDPKELKSSNAGQQERMRRSKGFYDPSTGEVVVVVPNNATVEDMAETVFHEVVAHRGLREMIGEDNYDAFCDEVYNHLKDDLRKDVDEETTRRFVNEPGKGYEHHRRVAVDEMFGRMAEKGFEDFTKAERGIWAKLKAKVLEAINKFLGSLKLPKWVKLGDNELRYMLWRSHEKLRTKGDYVDMARDAAKREELGLNRNDAVRYKEEEWKIQQNNNEFNNALSRYVSGDMKAHEILHLGQPQGVMRVFLPNLPIVLRQRVINKGTVKKHEVNLSAIKDMPGKLSAPIFVFQRSENTLGVLTDMTDRNGKNVCVAIELTRQMQDGNECLEVNDIRSFHGRDFKNILEPIVNNGTLRWVDKKKGLSYLSSASQPVQQEIDMKVLEDAAKIVKFFENPTIVEEESFEYRFRDGETDDIWKDQSLGLEERITNAAIRLSNNQSGDLTLRNDAMQAIGGNLTSLRKAMSAQGRYDRTTVKRVADLARILMQNGYLSGMTSGEIQRLLSAVKNSVGHKDVKNGVAKIMDIMVNNQLRNAEGTLRELLSIRGSKVDARGVEVQGMLDVEGQRTMEVVKKAMSLSEDDITDRIAEALNRMSDPDQTIADDAVFEYAGLHMALDYVQNIAGSKAEEKTLRDSLKTAKEDRDAGRMTDDAYKQFVEATEDAIRKNKVERAEAYFNLVGRLSDSLRESIENAKAFREAEKARVSEIHHNANSDMEGRPINEHHKDDWKDKFVNNGFVQFLFAPLGTFDQILRVFGNKSANGEGYLWNRFMRGWVDCRNKELTGVKEKFARLDEKAAELFGKGKNWGNLIRMEAKMPKATVSFWDGGEMRDHELTQGNLLYIYMVDKMTDGRMKLRRMGITEDDITRIENFLDPRFKALGDWLQDEFLVDTRNEYNETHKRMFGASMAAIENYFPLKILANARVDKEEDVNQQNRPDGITTKTGSIIKRRVNNLALDITGADALSVILDHITQMEHWSAYAEWNRDLNTLRTYKRFRNQVINMTTVYGGGRKLWENFNDLCLMAAGEYRPPVSKLNKSAVNLAKGVTAAKVSFRMYTALKQLLSAPAYAPEVSTRAILKSIANPYGDFKWCLENMPIFRERWHSRISGDPRLLKSDMDWKMWRSRIMELSSRIGMTPNAFVDAVTVSIGARAMYETRLKQYLKEGYPTDAAEKRAIQDATILFNQTQQSSESPFLSTMQVDKDWLSTLFTVFRNSSISYTRQEFDAIRNLKRNLTPGQRAKSIEFMTKQILRDWDVDPDTATDAERDQAQGAAKKRFRKQIKKDVLRLATFGFILELAWNLGPYLPYIIFGNDEDEKDKMWDDAMTHAYFGSVEGLTGGDVMSSFGNMWASGEWNWNQLSKDMPLASDINTIGSKFVGGKNAEAINDILNLLVQMGVGMNPQSITDTAIAITDACGDDPALSHEAAIFAMRVLQVPQSQIDKMYFDEVDLTGEEASKFTPVQLAQRYAEYKVKRGTPLAPWSWDDEERLGKYNDLATDRMKERLDAQGDATVIEAYAEFEKRYRAVSKKEEKARARMKRDYAAGARAYAALRDDPDYQLYKRFGKLDEGLGRRTRAWLGAQSAAEAGTAAERVRTYRTWMVETLKTLEKGDSTRKETSASVSAQ